MRNWLMIVGVVFLLFGLAFAKQHRLPEPNAGILWGGVAAVSFGAGAIGYSFGARRRTT
jgi:hypothetical protein